MEGLELFGSTDQKLDLPPNVDCNSHQSKKINYSSPHPNGHAKKVCIKEALNSKGHDVAHTTSISKINCIFSQWYIARLPLNSKKQCWAMETNTWIMCDAKFGTGKHGIVAPTYKRLKRNFCSTNNVQCKFWLCPNDIKYCVRGHKRNYVELAYSTQYVAGEGRKICLKRSGVGA